MPSRFLPAALLGLLLVFPLPTPAAPPAPPADLDSLVARAMAEFGVPGLALALVQDGQVVVTRGYGVKELGRPDPVDERTLFGIASHSKAFTAAALALLVDDGRLSWDDPVQQHLSDFQLWDPYVTREVTVRDLLCHRCGYLPFAADLLWMPATTYSRAEIVRRMRHFQPSDPFRARYGYNNILYVAAGQIIPAVTDTTWDDFVRARIFSPLGMDATNTSLRGFGLQTNRVTPHDRIDGVMRPVPWYPVDNAAPAAGINTCAADMAKWMILQLNRGRLDSTRRLFSEEQSREMWAAQLALPVKPSPAPLEALTPQFNAYGLGWGSRDYHGRRMISHSGLLFGMLSLTRLVPEENLGISVLTNAEESGALSALVYHLLDYYLDVTPGTDWIAAFRQAADSAEVKAAQDAAELAASRRPKTRPSLPLEKYCGRYEDPWYGTVTITQGKRGLAARFDASPDMGADLLHWQYDTFLTRFHDQTFNDAFLTFSLKPDGGIDQLKMTEAEFPDGASVEFKGLLFTPVPVPPDSTVATSK